MAGVAIRAEEVPPSFRPFAEAILGRGEAGTAEAGAGEALVRLLGTLGPKAPEAEARAFALLLRRRLPPGARLMRVTDLFLRPRYPAWHVRALNDAGRNRAYRRAIEALVRPGMVVLEVGTGSGLFAMMAARAGAAHVHACEADEALAAIARENVARNGLADRVTVHPCRYEELGLGTHLDAPADLVIHEFVASEFGTPGLSGMVATLTAGVARPGALFLPHAFAARGMIVGDEAPLDLVRARQRAEGLDVSAVNRLALAQAQLAPPVAVEAPLSAPFTLARTTIVPSQAQEPAERVADLAVPITAAGRATGVLQWIRHEFPDGSAYENAPGSRSHWWPIFHPFPAPIALRAGEALAIRVASTETELFIDPLEPAPARGPGESP